MEISVYNQIGGKTGTVELPENVFGLPWNESLVFQVATGQRANQRRKLAATKDRAEVSGGGKKPWRQKGTGRARHGSIRSPIWKGGGVTHGPIREKNFKKKINKKMAKKALFVVLSAKMRDKEILVLDELNFKSAKTKIAAEVFRNFSKNEDFKKITAKNGILVVLPKKDEQTVRAIRNLPYANFNEARNLTALEVLGYKYLLLPKASLELFKK